MASRLEEVAKIASTVSRPRAVIYDPIRLFPWSYEIEEQALAACGVELVLPADADAARRELPTADVVVVSQRMPSDAFALLGRCCGILCYSVGKDGVDEARATELGIPVLNVPEYCTEEVSDHAVALLLALQRLVVAFALEGARGNWDVRDWPEFMTMRRLRGQTVGIVGLGRIGSRVAEKVRGLEMKAIAYDPYREQATTGVELLPLEDVLEQADAIVLCAALTPDSRHVIDTDALARMRPDAVLVNVARGALVDEAALADALRNRRLRGAALDVREVEPTDPKTDPLLGIRNVVLTQHVAATSLEAWGDMHRLAADQILQLLGTAGRLAGSSAGLAAL